MPNDLSIDHIVIFVNDLDAATGNYRSLGFTVTPGGEHERFGTRNALIPFQDGSYLELIAWIEPEAATRPLSRLGPDAALLSAAERRVETWLNRDEGLVDFALLPTDIDEAVATAQANGLALDGPLDGSRTRPDGQAVLWKFAFPDAFDLPFLCADVSDRALRVPEGIAREHANGVTGIYGISVVVRNFLRSADRYGHLLNVQEEGEAGGAAQTRDFQVAGTTIRVIGAVGQHNAMPGNPTHEGPHALLLRANRDTPGQLDPHLTHGARIWWGPESALARFL